MNLKLKIDKYGNLINLNTNTIVVPSNELFIDNFWTTDGTTFKVSTTTQVTCSTNDTLPIVVPAGEFTQGSRADFYFRLHLPILDYNKKVNIFEFSTGTSTSYDISFYKPANYNGYYLYVNGSKEGLAISSAESLDIVGVLSICPLNGNTLAAFITLYTNNGGTLTKIVENAYRGGSGNVLYFGVSRDYHTNLSSYMVEGISFDEDIIINPSNNSINPILAITKYLNDSGVSEMWTNIKNWVTAQLLGKSNTGHTHVKNDITDFPTIPTKTSDLTNDSGFLTSHQSLSGYIPTSGGAVMTNYFLGRSVNTGSFMISGGTGWSSGGSIESFGSSHSSYAGQVRIQPALSDSNFKTMTIQPNGTWTWNGSACSVSSDSRLKDEISDISDEVLDAWENLEPKQYKLKSELETDKDNAQIHYGWIAQDVESIIKGNRKGDIKNGLWLHEEWEEQKEVSHEEKYTEEVETKDGKTKTVTKTRKVVDSPYRAKGDSYGLRYTECLVVECKYLRRCIARLTARIEELEKDNNVK